MKVKRDSQAGLTLVEVLVSLTIIALIAIAGFSLLNNTLGTFGHTDGRLQRLGRLQRAMHLASLDFEQATVSSLAHDRDMVGFTRHEDDKTLAISYGLIDGRLTRTIWNGETGQSAEQTLLEGLSGIAWSFWIPPKGWQTQLPDVDADTGTFPRAVAMSLVLGQASSGSETKLRRVVLLAGGNGAPGQ